MNKAKIITLLTDFGVQDVYVGVMKGVISQINSDLTLIDLTHDIPPQDLAAGSFALLSAYEYFPVDTVHLVVIDPGVGSSRRGVAIEFDRGFLVGADNGLFGNLLSQSVVKKAVSLDNPQYWRSQSSSTSPRSNSPSSTFHGRDIFAPIAAHLASGIEIEKLGTAIELASLVTRDSPGVKVEDDSCLGCVQYIDRFGNLITNIAARDLGDDKLIVIIHQQIIPMVATYSDRPKDSLIALIGSHGYLEIAVNCGDAQARLQAQVGSEVIVKSSISF